MNTNTPTRTCIWCGLPISPDTEAVVVQEPQHYRGTSAHRVCDASAQAADKEAAR